MRIGNPGHRRTLKHIKSKRAGKIFLLLPGRLSRCLHIFLNVAPKRNINHFEQPRILIQISKRSINMVKKNHPPVQETIPERLNLIPTFTYRIHKRKRKRQILRLYFPPEICNISLKCHTESRLHAFPKNHTVHGPLPIFFVYHLISIHFKSSIFVSTHFIFFCVFIGFPNIWLQILKSLFLNLHIF